MDDDGMLLNFDLSAPLVLPSTKTKLVGGSWKARQAAKHGDRPNKNNHQDPKDPNRTQIGRRRSHQHDGTDTEKGKHEDFSRSAGSGEKEQHQTALRSPDSENQAGTTTEARGQFRGSKRPRPEVDSADIPPGFITSMPTRPQSKKPKNELGAVPNSRPDRPSYNSVHTSLASCLPPNSLIAQEIKAASAANAQGPKQIVSSLFARQLAAEVQRAMAQAKQNTETQFHDTQSSLAPSNAPLTDEADTFVKLGLSPVIANHLVGRMEIKAPTGIQKLSLQEMLGEAHRGPEGCTKDFFIRAETGSGKTLAYLLPIVDQIIRITKEDGTKVNRESGVFAVILAPTRELCRQITDVLDKLLRCAVYVVAGSVNGGENKQKEKSRIRKGINILVATPGRLSDHLDNTRVFDVSKVRWLVLDEGDRMMEMGFEADIKKLLHRLDAGVSNHASALSELRGLPARRTTVLCSATMRMGAQKLGQLSLKDAVHIDVRKAEKMAEVAKAKVTSEGEGDAADDDDGNGGDTSNVKAGSLVAPGDGTAEKSAQSNDDDQAFAPAQLQQWYLATPPKLRLVSLVSVLRRALAHGTKKIIVFFSCADSVDFHFSVLTRTVVTPKVAASSTHSDQSQHHHRETAVLSSGGTIAPTETSPTFLLAPTLGSSLATTGSAGKDEGTQIVPILHRLHGSLPHPLRRGTLANFARPKQTSQAHGGKDTSLGTASDSALSDTPTILFTTDLSSRGLDLPHVDLVIEVDPAFSSAEHLHRVGRTARAGRNGRAIVFLTRDSSEMEYVRVLQACMRPESGQIVRGEQAEDVVRLGFGILDPSHQHQPSGSAPGPSTAMAEWEARATTFQLAVERWVLEAKNSTQGQSSGSSGKKPKSQSTALDLAKNAFQSHVRAYATHVAHERVFFNIKQLHLGHLCKAFGLRVAPSVLGVVGIRHTKGEEKAAGKKGKDGKDSAKPGKKQTQNKPIGDFEGGPGQHDDDDRTVAKHASGEDEDEEDVPHVPAPAKPGSSLAAVALGGEERIQEAKKKMKMAMRAMGGGGVSDFNLG